MSTLDVLTVKLEADIASFQQQLEKARAQLSAFGSATAPVDQGLARINTSATKSVAGLQRLNGAFIAITRQATGMSPLLARLTDVFGTFALGTGKMVPIVGGLAAIAGGFAWITREARATAKAAKEAGEAVYDAWMLAKTAGDKSLIDQQTEIGTDLDAVSRRIAEKRAAPDHTAGAAGRMQKLLDKQTELQTRYTQVTELLASRRAERQEDAAKRAATAEQKAASEAERAWREAVAAIETSVRQHHATFEGVGMPRLGGDPRSSEQVRFDDARGVRPSFPSAAEVMGAVFPPGFSDNTKAASEAVANLKEETDRLRASFAGGTGGGDSAGFFKGLGADLKGMLDPTMLATNLATGLVSSAIGLVIPKLTSFGLSIIGIGGAAEAAAAATRRAINSLRDQITAITGSEVEKDLLTVRQRIETAINDWFERMMSSSGGLHGRTGAEISDKIREGMAGMREAGSFEEFLAAIMSMRGAFEGSASGMEEFNEIVRLAKAIWQDVNGEVSSLTDSLRNIPSGWKVNLATFNATNVGAAPGTASARRSPFVLHLIAEPEGIFRVVEGHAVRKIRSGGRPAWEVAG